MVNLFYTILKLEESLINDIAQTPSKKVLGYFEDLYTPITSGNKKSPLIYIKFYVHRT